MRYYRYGPLAADFLEGLPLRNTRAMEGRDSAHRPPNARHLRRPAHGAHFPSRASMYLQAPATHSFPPPSFFP
ncbi:hypothetical protein FA95DRAFT_1557441 [Auriscalpium vulgare]|uniref:Uncharacterized protein n=1 Tax=Auriscalpium vulgare TaxID=40419 RepID=A0ACB8RX72_9AGAM|nr:hypothetical protein FA95DRAFT_1557441 [Auriscalpium vulgare]